MKYLILIFLSLPAFAIDFIEPTVVCERYLTKTEVAACEKKVKKMSPDFYLAAVCNQMNEDKELFECLNISADLDPKKLDSCSDSAMEDSTRLSCVRGLAAKKSDSFQRVPASK